MGIISRFFSGYERLHSTSEWDSLLPQDWPSTIMALKIQDRLHEKQGRSIARWVISSDFVVYLKRHYRLPLRDRLRALMFPTKPATPGLQEWHNLQTAQRLSIPIPQPLAAGEWLRPKLQLSSFIAIKELTDQIPLHEAIPKAYQTLTPFQFRQWKTGLIYELVRLSHLFHSNHYYHRDWYLCHFYILEQDTRQVPANWEGKVTVIDFHRMIYHRIKSLLYRSKDLAQLLYSSNCIGITNRDRFLFWILYRRSLSRQKLIKWLIIRKWKFYQRHDRPNG